MLEQVELANSGSAEGLESNTIQRLTEVMQVARLRRVPIKFLFQYRAGHESVAPAEIAVSAVQAALCVSKSVESAD
jgi:hypothetical protein